MDNVKEISIYFKNLTGIEFHNMEILKNKISIFCKHQNIDEKKLLDVLKISVKARQLFINNLTTNETYFNREFYQIQKLVELAKNKSYIKILSAPCSSGEEPYSIAIALLEAGMNNFEICGIDINDEILQKAKDGIYKARSIQRLDKNIVQKYFKKDDKKYILSNNIKRYIYFRKFNIFDKNISLLGKFDYVFSRNMFIYFDEEAKQKAKNILESLREDQNQEIFFGQADIF